MCQFASTHAVIRSPIKKYWSPTIPRCHSDALPKHQISNPKAKRPSGHERSIQLIFAVTSAGICTVGMKMRRWIAIFQIAKVLKTSERKRKAARPRKGIT
mmetsp:Transcript_15439/g.27649  ORF Transcript_15439/g.27649 Transcript_15439/m.27649 type:complete len:100 (+) Transcript_15439:667-966(+)